MDKQPHKNVEFKQRTLSDKKQEVTLWSVNGMHLRDVNIIILIISNLRGSANPCKLSDFLSQVLLSLI